MLGIIGAMPVEVEALKRLMESVEVTVISGVNFYCGKLCGTDVVVAASGVGKVNAAICTQTMILSFKTENVINVGVAGGLSKDLKVCDIAIADSVVEHDMNTSVCGDPLGYISGLNTVYMKSDESISSALYTAAKALGTVSVQRGVIASGDQFISSTETKKFITDNFNAIAAEMEGASIGHVCAANKVPFGILRAISDSADDSALMSFEKFAEEAVRNSISIILKFLEEYNK